MKSKTDEMLLTYGLTEESSIFSVLDDFKEEEIRKYCWQVLHSYGDLQKVDWIIGLEGGDYIYSFGDHYVFITDDIWSFDLIAKRPALELLAENMKALKVNC
jgi:hypothetical protein